MQIGNCELAAVIDLSAGAAEFHDLRPWAEVRVGVDLVGRDIAGAYGRRLILEIDACERHLLVLQRFDQHPPGGAADRRRNRFPLQVFELVEVGVDRDDDRVAGPLEIVAGACEQDRPQAFGLLKLRAIHDQRIITHGAEMELASQHLIGDWAARRIVGPGDVVGSVGVLAAVRQVFFEQLEALDHDAAGVRIGTHSLVPDCDIDGLGCGGTPSRQQEHRCQKKDALEVHWNMGANGDACCKGELSHGFSLSLWHGVHVGPRFPGLLGCVCCAANQE